MWVSNDFLCCIMTHLPLGGSGAEGKTPECAICIQPSGWDFRMSLLDPASVLRIATWGFAHWWDGKSTNINTKLRG